MPASRAYAYFLCINTENMVAKLQRKELEIQAAIGDGLRFMSTMSS